MRIAIGVLLSAMAFAAVAQQKAKEPGASTEGLDMQEARAKMMGARGAKLAYTKKFDLSGLPAYQPKQKVKGTLRIWGSNYITDGKVGGYWEEAFRKYHPDAKIEWNMKTTGAAVPALVFGVSDVGIGVKITFAQQHLFEPYKDPPPHNIDIATPSFPPPSSTPHFPASLPKQPPPHHNTP